MWLPVVRAKLLQSGLEKETAAHSSLPVWRIPWTEEPDGYSPRGHKESDTAERQQQTAARQAPLSMGFSRRECWSGLPSLLRGVFPTQGWNPHLYITCLGRRVLHH